jgi:diguanylate cyclase
VQVKVPVERAFPAAEGKERNRLRDGHGLNHAAPTRLRIKVDTVLLVAPSAREILEQAAASGADLEAVARSVLERLADLTGLSSTYLAETRLLTDEQYIVFSCNRSDLFHIPEDVTLPWSEGVCRFVVEGGPHYTSDAQKQFPSSSVARLLEIRTFVSYPVFTPEGRFFGTLCGASKEPVDIKQEILELMRECALLIGRRLPATTP